MKTPFLIFLAAIALAFEAKAQTFTLIPDPLLKVKGATWTGQSVQYNASDRSFSAPGGLYVPDVYNVKGGLYVEAQVWLESGKGELFTKANTCSYGVDCSKLLVNYCPLGADRAYGIQQLPLKQWITVGFGIDTVGRTVFKVDSIIDLVRNTVFSGPLPQTTNTQFTFFKGYTGLRCRSIKVWAGKPPISTTGFNVTAKIKSDTLRLRFSRIDRSQLGTKLTIIQEDPKGTTRTRYVGKLLPGSLKLPYKDSLNGSWTFTIKTAKMQIRKTCYKGPAATMPKDFVIGMYSVPCDSLKVVAKWGINAQQPDYCIINLDKNWKAVGKYMDTGRKYGIRTVNVMGTQSSKGNLQFADSVGKRGLLAFYPDDEQDGVGEGIERNYWACKSLFPSVAIAANSNNYSRLEEWDEKSDFLWINTYGTGRQVYDQTSRAASLAPVFVSLPQYPAYRYGYDTLQNMVAQAVVGGASGIFWFSFWDGPKKWMLTKDCPKCAENIRKCNLLLNGLPLSFQPLETGNPNVKACNRSGEIWAVNLSSTKQKCTVNGEVVELEGLGVKIW